MFDPHIEFFERIFNAIGRGIGVCPRDLVEHLHHAAGDQRGLHAQAIVGGFVLILVGLYAISSGKPRLVGF